MFNNLKYHKTTLSVTNKMPIFDIKKAASKAAKPF